MWCRNHVLKWQLSFTDNAAWMLLPPTCERCLDFDSPVTLQRFKTREGGVDIVPFPLLFCHHSTHSHPICSDVCSPDCVTSPTAPVTWLQHTHNTKLPRNSSWNKVASKWTALLWRENSPMPLCCILSLNNKNYVGDKGHLKMWIRNTEIVGNAD